MSVLDEALHTIAPLLGETPEQAARFDASGALAESAMWYARRGWPVFPCVPNDKVPATRNGLHDATTDVERVVAWWQACAAYNIGVATGHRFDVIDIDMPDGPDTLAAVRERAPLPEVLAVVRTPSGGAHIYVPVRGGDDGESRNRAGRWPGIDIRGLGGYVIAPPSRIANVRYRWALPPRAGLAD